MQRVVWVVLVVIGWGDTNLAAPTDLGTTLFVIAGGAGNAIGARHACALQSTGAVRCWGYYGRNGGSVVDDLPANMPAIATGL